MQDLTALATLRDRLAAAWHTRQGRRIPLEEYQSMGNEAVAEALATHSPEKGLSLVAYTTMLLHNRLRQVRVQQAGAGNRLRERGNTKGLARYQTVTQDEDWWPVHAGISKHTGESRVYLKQIFAYLRPRCSRMHWRMLERTVHGETLQAIGDRYHMTPNQIDYILRGLRQQLRDWQRRSPREAA